MKYNILINQKAAVESGLLDKLDLVDFVIFDFLYDFFNCDFESKITFNKNGEEYVEIRHNLLEEQIPILKIGSRKTFINRMNKLIDAGIIERYENNQTENRSAYKKGANWGILVFDEPVKNDSHPCEKQFTPPVKNNSHNNIDKYNIDIKDKKEDTKKDELFEECWKSYRRKGAKGKAKIQWDKLSDSEKSMAFSHIPAYVSSCSEVRFQKDFERYLRDKIFNNVVYKGNTTLFDPEQVSDSSEYRPRLDGRNMLWIESEKCYMTTFDLSMLNDGYTSENRPSSAIIMYNGWRYKWNVESKKWEKL